MSGYGIDSIGAYSNDPYLAYALQSYNPNFRGAAQAQAQTQSVTAPSAVTTTDTTAGLPKADYSESSNTGVVAGALGTVLTAAALFCFYKKGKGEGLSRIGNGFKKVFGIGESSVSKAAEKAAKAEPIKNIKVVMKNNKPVYYLPGKTKEYTDPQDIANFMQDKELRRLTGLRFKTGETKVKSGTFNVIGPDNKNYTVKFNGNKIEEIRHDDGSLYSELLENGGFKNNLTSEQDTLADKIKDFITKIKDGDVETVMGKDTNLRDFTYVTKIGDNSATVFRPSISLYNSNSAVMQGLEPQVKSVTKLKEFSADSKEVLAEIRRCREAGNNVDEIIAESFVKKGRLPAGYKVQEFEIKDGNNFIKIVDGKPVGMTVVENSGKKKFYNASSDDFLAYIEKYEQSINKKIKKALDDNKIPSGAIIAPV